MGTSRTPSWLLTDDLAYTKIDRPPLPLGNEGVRSVKPALANCDPDATWGLAWPSVALPSAVPPGVAAAQIQAHLRDTRYQR